MNTITPSFVCKKVTLTDALEDYTKNKLKKLEKLIHEDVEATFRFETLHTTSACKLLLHFSSSPVSVHAEDEDLYNCIDKVIEKLSAKLKKWKSKIHSSQKEKTPKFHEIPVQVLQSNIETEEVNDLIDREGEMQFISQNTPPVVVKEKKKKLYSLTVEEAVMKLELSHGNFIVFKDEKTLKVCIVYKRRDDSYGIMRPE